MVLLLLIPMVWVGCRTQATSEVTETEGLGFSRDALLGSDEDASSDVSDTSDLFDIDITEDLSAQLGQACSILNACNEFSDLYCCDESVKCTADIEGFGVCILAGGKREGEACGADGDDDCVAGLFCANLGQGAACYRFCNPRSAEDGCSSETTCTAAMPWIREAVGLCR